VTVDQPPAQGVDSEFATNIVNQIFDLWVGPELEKRGLTLTRADISKVLVEMEPDRPLRVLINDEAQLVADLVTKRDIAEGEEVTVADIDELTNLQPLTVGLNSGWICFVRIGNRGFVAFDFTYNRARAAALLDRAREFLAVAVYASDWAPGAAIDNAHSAAELTVQAQMLVHQVDSRSHRERREWLASWADHQNSPQHHADVLWNLADLRVPARYGSGELELKPGRLTRILRTVQEMIDLTSARVHQSKS